MTRSRKRLVTFIGALLATAGVIVAACFAVNCLVDRYGTCAATF